MNQTELTIATQRRIEELFAGAAFAIPRQAMDQCAWLDPEIIQTEGIRRFWKAMNNGHKVDALNGFAEGAALEAGIYQELINWASESILVFSAVESYAREIQRRHWLVGQDKAIGALLQARQKNDVEGMREAIATLSADCPPKQTDLLTTQDIAIEFMEELEKPKPTGIIYTGIPNLDRAMGGMERGAGYFMASRPSMGKSTLAFEIARNIANTQPVIYFSNEMGSRSLWAKAACGIAEVQWRDVRNRRVTAEQMQAVKDASNQLMCQYEDRLIVDDSSRHTTDDLWRLVSQYKPVLFVVDIMARLKDRAANEIKRLGNIAYALREIAKETDCVMLAIHHVNRGTETKEGQNITGRKPVMSDLRDSGEIEQAADVILFLHSDEYYQVSSTMKPPRYIKTSVIIAKDREGPRNGEVELAYDTAQQWFYPASEIWKGGK
jgi:replicative DNA helicase